jgi:hypothetical protein
MSSVTRKVSGGSEGGFADTYGATIGETDV